MSGKNWASLMYCYGTMFSGVRRWLTVSSRKKVSKQSIISYEEVEGGGYRT